MNTLTHAVIYHLITTELTFYEGSGIVRRINGSCWKTINKVFRETYNCAYQNENKPLHRFMPVAVMRAFFLVGGNALIVSHMNNVANFKEFSEEIICTLIRFSSFTLPGISLAQHKAQATVASKASYQGNFILISSVLEMARPPPPLSGCAPESSQKSADDK